MSMWFYVVLLAVTQGVAEFLPISSSGHLALLGAWFGVDTERSLSLGILLHAGSLTAIVLFYFRTLLSFLKPDRWRLACMVVIGTIPAGIGGVALKATGWDERMFGDLMAIGVAFLITATLLRLSEKPKLILRSGQERGTPPTELEAITLRQAAVIGTAQMFAILPGISRSGSTIAAGILTGVGREAAGTFSFLLAIPAIGGAAFLELLSMWKKGGAAADPGALDATQAVVGFFISAAVSYAALAWLIRLIRKGRLAWFSWYLYTLGTAVVLWQIAVMVRHG